MAKKKKLGADLPPGIVDQFNEWCDQNVLQRGGAASRALMLIQFLPLKVRSALLGGHYEHVQSALLRAEEAIPEAVADQRISVEDIAQALRPVAPGRQKKRA